MKTIQIILPCYNEQDSLPIFFNQADRILKEVENYSFSYILVDDGSKDKTFEVMKQLYDTRDDITLVKESRNFGQNNAFTAGLLNSTADYVITMDCDLQDPLEVVVEICKKFDQGYDVVNPHMANRKEDSFFKRTTAGMFYKLVNKLEGKKVIPENVNLFRGLSRRVVDTINTLPEKDRFYCALIPLVGFKTATVDYVRVKRSAGKSKYHVSKMFNYAFDMLSNITAKPLYLPIQIGAICSIIFAITSLTFLVFFILHMCSILNVGVFPLVNIICLILSTILFVGSVIIFFIGLLSLYQHNILINTRNRDNVIVDKVYKQDEKNKTENEIE